MSKLETQISTQSQLTQPFTQLPM
uniref:Uncharacterized protein n=1 Tax=Tetranychus urticae TaxID=32264 RepID=T1KQX9_TETUR